MNVGFQTPRGKYTKTTTTTKLKGKKKKKDMWRMDKTVGKEQEQN